MLNPSSFAKQSPKIHLHCHLEGTLRATTFLELTQKYDLSTRFRPGEHVEGPRDLESVYTFADFREFLMLFGAVSRSLRTVDDYGRLAREFAEDAAAQNVRYGELFISPTVWTRFYPDLDVTAIVKRIHEELNQGKARFQLIVDVTRNFGVESAARTVDAAIGWQEYGVIGIGLGGDEAAWPATLFEAPFARAREHGLHVVAHAGEAAPARSVIEALEVGAERIGHGIRAVEDPNAIAALKRHGIAVEVCPTSNYRTAVVGADDIHPIGELDAHGVAIVVDADDPTLFGTSISQEYDYVERQLGRAALVRFIGSAVLHSFLEPQQKQALYERVYAELAALQ